MRYPHESAFVEYARVRNLIKVVSSPQHYAHVRLSCSVARKGITARRRPLDIITQTRARLLALR